MKKIIVIFFLIVYTFTAWGLVINYHYCNDHLANISFLNFGSKSGCACNPKGMPKDCCKDELRYEKADNHKTVQQVSILNLTLFSIELPATNNHYLTPAQDGYGADFSIDRVQRSCHEPIYLLNRVFLI